MHTMYFDINPFKSDLVNSLTLVAGQKLNIQQVGKDCLLIGVENQKVSVEVDWINERRSYDSNLEEILREKYVYHFPDRNQCIRISTESANYDYLEITVLYLLIQAGGKLERDFELPTWAGKSWKERPKKWWQLT